MTLKIYGVLRSRASRNVWLAKELGLKFEHVPVIQAYRLTDPAAPGTPLNTASPAYREINPNGLIPTMDDDGLVLHESLAINLYLAKKHGGPLAPRDLREEGLMTMWALWAMTECEPYTLQILYHRKGAAETEQDRTIADTAVNGVKRPFGVLDRALREGGGYVVGRRFTVADINTAEIFRYAQPAADLFTAHPNVKAWLETCQARPAFKAMMAARNEEPA
jgi:glutathione S-transferase